MLTRYPSRLAGSAREIRKFEGQCKVSETDLAPFDSLFSYRPLNHGLKRYLSAPDHREPRMPGSLGFLAPPEAEFGTRATVSRLILNSLNNSGIYQELETAFKLSSTCAQLTTFHQASI